MTRTIFAVNKIVKNISYSLSGKVIAMIFLILLDIFTARVLKISEYAEWSFFFSILTMMFYIGWFGINISAKVFISKCNNFEELRICTSEAFTLRLISSISFLLVAYMIVPNLVGILGYPEKYPNLKSLLYISPILVFLNSFTEFYKEFFTGTDKFKKVFEITVLEYGGYFLFSLVLLFTFGKIQSVAFGYLFSGICVSILGLISLKSEYSGIHVISLKLNGKYLWRIFRYAIPMALISLGTMILVEMDTFMLGILSTKTDLATYSIAKNINAKATHLNYAITVGSMTSFSTFSDDGLEKKKKQFRKMSRINLLITIVVSLLLLISAPILIVFFYGKDYIFAETAICFLVPYYALYGISNFYAVFLDFREKAKLRSIAYISIIVINLILNCLLIPKYGSIGAAVATDFSLVPYTIFVVILSKRELQNLEGGLAKW
jgi:O-antigen/teichoic acid export membrane protein